MRELLHFVQRGRDWGWGPSPPRPLLAIPNVTAHPSTVSVPITVLLYNGPLFCDFNVSMKGLTVFQLLRTAYFLMLLINYSIISISLKLLQHTIRQILLNTYCMYI